MATLELPIKSLTGETLSTVKLNPNVFGVAWQPALIHQVVTSQESNKRQPIAHTKTRAEVRGGGAKPWKQKGTGRARHGSSRSPIWVGGGVTFGPRNTRNFHKKVNIKARRKALCMALTVKFQAGKISLVETLKFDPPRPKRLPPWCPSSATRAALYWSRRPMIRYCAVWPRT